MTALLKEDERGRVVSREPCPKCGSRDNLARYEDGHAYCFGFGCKYYEHGDREKRDETKGVPKTPLENQHQLIDFEIPGGLPSRKLAGDTLSFFGYGVGEYNGRPCQVASYRDETGATYLQKLRFEGKKFTQLGDTKRPGLFGQNKWRGGGKRLVITEGEVDAMSVAQAMSLRWPVVSIRNGASGAAKDIAAAIDFVASYETIVLCFDNDKPGREATAEVAAMLPPGKVVIANLPLKDASDMLQEGRTAELVRCIWEATPYRPDGVVGVHQVLDQVLNEEEPMGVPYPFDGVTDKLKGLRSSEIVTFTMGSGVGKSTLVRQIAYYLHMRGEQVGMLMLEETARRTAKHLLSLHMRQRLMLNPAPREAMEAAWRDMFKEREVYLYDHFGSTQIDNLLNRIRFMAVGLKCKWIVLDHLSIAVSGLEIGDERKELDLGMTKLRQLVQELDIGLLLVVHLKRPSGDKGFEQEGMRPRMNHIRGTQGIAQLSDSIITGGRGEGGVTNIWIEKNRMYGEVHGEDEAPTLLKYDKQTGWFHEVASEFEEAAEGEENEEARKSTAF